MSKKVYRYVFYKLQPVFAISSAESKNDLSMNFSKNGFDKGGHFVELNDERECIRNKIPIETIDRLNECHSISFIEEIKDD